MIEINYKSDFTIEIEFKGLGVDETIPDYNFELSFNTGGVVSYLISKIDDKLTNCYVSDGSLIGVFENHGLSRGLLMCESSMYYPNESFDGGVKKIVSTYKTDAILIAGVGNELEMALVSLIAPTFDYTSLENKPQINGVELEGNVSSEDIKLNESFVSIDE